jgi:hypothetical protein
LRHRVQESLRVPLKINIIYFIYNLFCCRKLGEFRGYLNCYQKY